MPSRRSWPLMKVVARGAKPPTCAQSVDRERWLPSRQAGRCYLASSDRGGSHGGDGTGAPPAPPPLFPGPLFPCLCVNARPRQVAMCAYACVHILCGCLGRCASRPAGACDCVRSMSLCGGGYLAPTNPFSAPSSPFPPFPLFPLFSFSPFTPRHCVSCRSRQLPSPSLHLNESTACILPARAKPCPHPPGYHCTLNRTV